LVIFISLNFSYFKACCPWSHESDVWSIGCILLELFSGDLFFETHETYEHLAMIDRACGKISR